MHTLLNNRLCVGVDVGETNTDAVILLNKEILCSTKVLTTWEVTSGIVKAISLATKQLPRALQKKSFEAYREGQHWNNPFRERHRPEKESSKSCCVKIVCTGDNSNTPSVRFS